MPTSPGPRRLLSDSSARLVAARALTSRRARRSSGRFLAEGAQPVEAALRHGSAIELFATDDGAARQPWLVDLAEQAGVPVDLVSAKSVAGLSETATPQGIVAVCRRIDVTLEAVFAHQPTLIAALVETNDPGNAGTIVRTADAAGADAVVFVGGVDVYNGKAVRASAGSLFHLAVVTDVAASALLAAAAEHGLTRLATGPTASRDLDTLAASGLLRRPTLWLFGSEAHGLPAPVLAGADEQVRLPIYGQAESLNLAVAAGLCLYASAREQRSRQDRA